MQCINNFTRNKTSRKIPDFAKHARSLGVSPDGIVTLNHNHRSPRGIIRCINGYYQSNFPALSPEYLYSVDSAESSHGDQIEIHCFHTHQDESAFVENMRGDFVLLSRAEKPFERLKTAADKRTIHSFKGEEADNVLVFNFSPPGDDIDELMIAGVAISRARQKLIITTAFPASKIAPLFAPGTVRIIDHTLTRRKAARLPSLQPRKTTPTLFNKSTIDSIGLVIHKDDAPFVPYIRQSSEVRKKRYVNTSLLQSRDGVPYTVSYHHTHSLFTFGFTTLHPLRAAGYTDIQILRYVENEILQFFDGRISGDSIELGLLHISKVGKFRNPTRREAFLKRLFARLAVAQKPVRSVVVPGNANSSGLPETVPDLSRETLYINYGKKRGRSVPVNLTLYDPSQKPNDYAFPVPRPPACLAKFEFRLNNRKTISQKRFLGKTNTFSHLVGVVHASPNWYESMITRFFAFNAIDHQDAPDSSKAHLRAS